MRRSYDIIVALLTPCVLVTALSAHRATETPAADSHQGVTLAAIPVTDEAEAEKIFGKKAAPLRAGVLPVEIVITNERAEAVRVTLERIELVTEQEKFAQADPERVGWLLYPPPKVTEGWERARRQPKDKDREKREEAQAALRARQLRAEMVPAGASARGYLFFEMGKANVKLAEVRLYIPEVVVLPGEEPLLYFEIELEPDARP
ncbi:MAG: hypothetical protein HYY26_07475 [Acidobacteria bacterium]|nr:hypothetical protein [Acidobacteriota bacterium]